MKMWNRIWSALVVFCFCVIGLIAVPSSAQATSNYDDLISVTSDLFVYTDGPVKTQKMNLKDIWWDEYKEALQKRQNLQPSFGPTGFVSGFESVMETGSWAVYVEKWPAGNTINIVGTNDPNAYCDFYTEPTDTKKYLMCKIHPGYDWYEAPYLTHSSYGGNGCGYGICTSNGLATYTEPWVVSNSTGGAHWMISETSSAVTDIYAMNFSVNYPSGYAGAVAPGEPELQEYVAMGDSFSSGEGVEPFLVGTDIADDLGTNTINEENRCHRSAYAYPKLLQRDANFSYSLEFVACSGATTSNITTTGQWGELAQINALSESTDVVTLTVGGNDVGFQEFATACLSPLIGECDEFTDVYDDTMGAIATLQPSIDSTLSTILTEAPNATVYVIGYPHIAPYHEYVLDEDDDCTALFQPFLNAWGNGRAARDVVDGLNHVLNASVNAVNMQKETEQLVFVDTSSGAFYGHDTCADDGQGYFNGIDYINQEYTAHPNMNGQIAFKEDFAEVAN